MGLLVKMIKLPDKNTAYVDVDDILVLWTIPAGQEEQAIIILDCADEPVVVLPHYRHIQAIKEHKARGHCVVVWSQGGSDWAEKVVIALNLTEYVDLVISKPSWFYDDIPAHLFMSETQRFWRDPNKSTKVIQSKNDNGNDTPDK